MPKTSYRIPNFRLGRVRGKPNLYVLWTEEGKPRRESTGTENEAAARRYLDDFKQHYLKVDTAAVTVSDCIESYLNYKRQQSEIENRKTSFVASLEQALNRVRDDFGYLNAESITRLQSRNFIQKMKKTPVKNIQGDVTATGYSNGTIRKSLILLSAALKHAERENLITKAPHIEKPSPPLPRDKWATKEQVRHLLDTIQTPHIKLFAMLALHTVSRKQAILELKWEQVDFARKQIDFNIPGRMETTKRRVPTPMNTLLYDAMKEAQSLAYTDFVIEYLGKPVSDIKKGFNHWAAEAGLDWITPHTLRHTGATLMAQGGVPLWEIAGIMGDEVETVTKHYAKHCPEYLKKATSALEKIYE